MSRYVTSQGTIPCNHDGFVPEDYFFDWTSELARMIAGKEGVELTFAHMEILRRFRQWFEEKHYAPRRDAHNPQALRISKKILARHLGTVPVHIFWFLIPARWYYHLLEELFPGGCSQVCKIAGLPNSN